MLTTLGAGATVATSGCVRRFRNTVNRRAADRLSLTITTLPTDGDRESIQVARTIAAALETVGADVSIEILSGVEFLRTILINQDFDVYVGTHPADTDPAFLYEALHSRYADEAGWQNPFGYTDLTFDDRLEAQRTADGEARREAVGDTLEALAVEQPFVPICIPDEYRLVRTDRFTGWGNGHPATRLGYLGLEVESERGDGTDTGNDDGTEPAELRTAHVNARPSQNLNPLSAEYRSRGTIVDLLYDSLAIAPVGNSDLDGAMLDGESESAAGGDSGTDGGNESGDGSDDEPAARSDFVPWLAADWEWNAAGDTMTIRLRENCRFHDGEPLTAEDVAFTYRFLADTGLGDLEVAAPSPRHRGRVDAVETVAVVDDHRLELTVDASRAVGEYALTVPILPKHVWEPRAAAADVPGVRVAPGTTKALVTDNLPPVGSGPYRFASRADRDYVAFERVDDHFTRREDVPLPEPTADRLRFGIDPRSTSAIERVETDEVDVTSTTLESYVVDDALEVASATEHVDALKSESWLFYHLGFNARKPPFSNPRFRRCVARLIDKAWLVEDVFGGHARPVAAPVTEEWTPEELRWDGEDPETPFLGRDGEIDVDAARDAFEAAGFRYDGEGRLRVRH
ncbi:hypothetical protein GCM10028856_05150 [Halopiger thermotolerans]